MNFSLLSLFILISLIVVSIISCGIKGPPTAPKDNSPNYVNKFISYPKQESKKEEEQQKQKK